MGLDTGVRKVASALYSHLNTPRALTCHLLLKHGEWDQLATMAVDPRNFLEGSIGAEKYRRDAQASDLLRKSPLLPVKASRRKAAEKTFWESEKQCFHTNQLLDLLQYPSTADAVVMDRFREILLKSRKICGRILGPLPDQLEGGFGPGTSFELKGEAFSTLADKLWITPHTTPDCAQLFEHMFWSTLWGRTRQVLGLPLPTLTSGNRFSTVPKDATKDRGICIEPLGNLWVQLGIGGYLKRRLSRVGLHVGKSSRPLCPIQRLKTRSVLDGQTHHRIMARDGSRDGTWATIDLSNASDTMAFKLVQWVLPADWFQLLCAARSPYTQIGNKRVLLDKFSSMGNGSTFELETLVFAAILAAGLELKVGVDLFVYGDDILVPSDKGRDAVALLKMSGFTPNEKKTFLSGPFRESCGGDYFSGHYVRPFSMDGKYESPLEWMSTHNELMRRWPGAILALKRCREQVPLRLRVFGPSFLGDSVFRGNPLRTWVEDGSTWCHRVNPIPLRLPIDRWGSEFSLTLACLWVPSTGLIPRLPPEGYRLLRASIS